MPAGSSPPAPPGRPVIIPTVGKPTDYLCGSAAKVIVLTARASRREALFHPHDNPEIDSTSRAAHKDSSTSGLPRGMCWDGRVRRYRVRVSVGGERHYLGCFETIGL